MVVKYLAILYVLAYFLIYLFIPIIAMSCSLSPLARAPLVAAPTGEKKIFLVRFTVPV